ncbi:hypothetical protein QUF74_14035 [Candidatus Halobeggiatoa sp. HSG11]|nr:hypothetical protein [Candidatus Halobeggiatoa sp. HSG11]
MVVLNKVVMTPEKMLGLRELSGLPMENIFLKVYAHFPLKYDLRIDKHNKV